MAIALVFTIIIGTCASIFFYFLAKFKSQAERVQNEVDFLRGEKEKSEEKINFLQQKNVHLETQNQLLKSEQQQVERQREEWNKDKETILLQLSENLIKKNNEQQNQISANQQENIILLKHNIL
jgi:septal ring factor EnvC (AmiA/AmiB activator)